MNDKMKDEETYPSTDFLSNKEKILSLRISENLYNALEAQTANWNGKSISETVRTILNMYFLPMVYALEWKDRKPEQLAELVSEQQESGYSLGLSRFYRFVYELTEYYEFLSEAEENSSLSLKRVQDLKETVEKLVQEMSRKLKYAEEENQEVEVL